MLVKTMTRIKKPYETEIENILARGLRKLPEQKTGKVLYIIHPESNTYDGDPSEAAKEGVNKYVNQAADQNDIARLVYPLSVGVYIDPQIVTDIRGGDNESTWVDFGDLEGVDEVTLVGGNLRKCLGITYNNIVSELMHYSELTEVENPELNVVLPLESIYTEYGCTAEKEFLAGISSLGNEKDSIITLLSGINPERNHHDKTLLEYGFINPHTNQTINLYENGKLSHTFCGDEIDSLTIDDEPELTEPGTIRIECCLPPLGLPKTMINLNVLYDESKKYSEPVDTKLAEIVMDRWKRINEPVQQKEHHVVYI